MASDHASVEVRPAQPGDADAIADLWHEGWRDGHLEFAPDELRKARTLDAFQARTAQRLEEMTVATVDGAVAGFVIVTGDEVEQVYVHRAHRGTDVACALLREGERRVGDQGYDTAWLAVIDGNARARAFYAREGWVDEGLVDYEVPATEPTIVSEVHRYTKALA